MKMNHIKKQDPCADVCSKWSKQKEEKKSKNSGYIWLSAEVTLDKAVCK
jgi:hypothetical protein